MTREKKKIDTKKIIYRKLRQSEKKSVTKIAALAVFMITLAMVVPGICTGMDIPANPDPEFPSTEFDGQETEVAESSEEPEFWPPKLQSEPIGISGQSTHTYHI